MEFKVIGQQCIFEVNLEIYEVDVICKAAYQFIDHTYVYFDVLDTNKVKVYLESKQEISSHEIELLGKTFSNELLSQKVRFSVSQQTKNIRELIVGRALYSTCVEIESGEEVESEVIEYTNDKEPSFTNLDDIAISWFEQYPEE